MNTRGGSKISNIENNKDELVKIQRTSVDYKYTGEMNALCGDSGKWGGAKQLREMGNTWR